MASRGVTPLTHLGLVAIIGVALWLVVAFYNGSIVLAGSVRAAVPDAVHTPLPVAD